MLARITVSASPSFDAVQSAYRRRHSTETALLKITDDIFAGFGNRQSTILVALDQSAAFDCIDHTTLIRRLDHTFGVTGKALNGSVLTCRADRRLCAGSRTRPKFSRSTPACHKDRLLGHCSSRCTLRHCPASSTRSVSAITSTPTTHKCTQQCL